MENLWAIASYSAQAHQCCGEKDEDENKDETYNWYGHSAVISITIYL